MTASQVRRIIAATLIALVALSGTTALGFWQYARAHRDDIAQQVLAEPAVPVQTLVQPGAYVPERAFTHAVAVRGTLHSDRAILSCERMQADGSSGCWLVAPVVLGDAAPAITMVLGFVPSADATRELDAVRALGQVHTDLVGRLQPGEVFERGNAIMRPTDRIDFIAVNDLAMLWDTPLHDGYVVLEGRPQGNAVHLQAVTSSLIAPPSGITWRNLFYAWQWWAFAAFVLFLLARYVMDVRRESVPIPASDDEETS